MLSPSTSLIASSEQSLLEQLRPGVDGVTLKLGDCRGTFLPQVWESLPDPLEFWSQELAVSRYTVEKFAEAQAA